MYSSNHGNTGPSFHDLVVEIGSAEPLGSVTEWQMCVVACRDPGA